MTLLLGTPVFMLLLRNRKILLWCFTFAQENSFVRKAPEKRVLEFLRRYWYRNLQSMPVSCSNQRRFRVNYLLQWTKQWPSQRKRLPKEQIKSYEETRNADSIVCVKKFETINRHATMSERRMCPCSTLCYVLQRRFLSYKYSSVKITCRLAVWEITCCKEREKQKTHTDSQWQKPQDAEIGICFIRLCWVIRYLFSVSNLFTQTLLYGALAIIIFWVPVGQKRKDRSFRILWQRRLN